MLEVVVLIWEHFPIDALPAPAVTSGKVTALAHELGDDTVEMAAFVVQRLPRLAHTLLTGAQSKEIHRGLWSHISAKHKYNAANVLASDLDVKESSSIEVPRIAMLPRNPICFATGGSRC